MKITRERLDGYKISGEEVLVFPNGDCVKLGVLIDFIIESKGDKEDGK